MKKTLQESCQISVLSIVFLAVLLNSAYAQRPQINTDWLVGPAPTINGAFPVGEWSNPQLILTNPDYPILTYVYFVNNDTHLFVMVDAVGDTTDTSGDECLLVFGFPPNYVSVNISGTSSLNPTGNNDPPGMVGAIGHGPSPNSQVNHKIYEFMIPLQGINAAPGQPIDFASPPWKNDFASMPYDSSTSRDNVYLPGLSTNPNDQDINKWAILSVASQPITPIPTLNEWGMMMLALLMAGMAFWRIRQKKA